MRSALRLHVAVAPLAHPRHRFAPPLAAPLPRSRRRCASGEGEAAPIGADAPPGLAGLRLREDGELVDEAGRTLNSLGATRFDVAVQAMRGAIPMPADPAASNERGPAGQITRSCATRWTGRSRRSRPLREATHAPHQPLSWPRLCARTAVQTRLLSAA